VEKYGFKTPSSNNSIKNKISETNVEKYGFSCPLLNTDILKKAKDTLGPFLNYYANDSATLQIAHLYIDSLDQHWFLDRFSANIHRFTLEDSSTISYQLRTWNFKDSSACLEAFYNWLDQAGKNNSSVPLLKGSVPSDNYNLMIVSEKQILYIASKRAIDF
jgi:hypothetical protein